MSDLSGYTVTREQTEVCEVNAFSEEDAIRLASIAEWRQVSEKITAVQDDRALRAAMMKVIRDAWDRLDHQFCRSLWRLQDGYGTPGFVPEQGFDWSGIRDSSLDAVKKMFIYSAGK